MEVSCAVDVDCSLLMDGVQHRFIVRPLGIALRTVFATHLAHPDAISRMHDAKGRSHQLFLQ